MEIGDHITKVNGKEISTKTELQDVVAHSKGEPLLLEVRRGSQVKPLSVTPVPGQGQSASPDAPAYTIGVEETPPLVTSVMHGLPASTAGVQPGDRVVNIDGQTIYTWLQMTTIVRDSPNKLLHVDVLRNGQRIPLTVTPSAEKATVNGQAIEVGKIGISGPGRSLMRADNPLQAVYQGLDATWGWTELTAIGLYKMVVGDISSKNIGGPLTIANISGEAASQGASSVVFLIAILSINLGVLNLLPIPLLDGGHLMYYFVEIIKGSPVSERAMELGQRVGLALLLVIMAFAFYNDLNRLFSG